MLGWEPHVRFIRPQILGVTLVLLSGLSALAASSRAGHVVAVSIAPSATNDGSQDAPAFRAGLAWLGPDGLPTQSAELAVGSASASVAEIVPIEDGAFIVRVEVSHSAIRGFSEIQRVDADGWVAWRHRVLRGLGGGDVAPSGLDVTPEGEVVVTFRSRSGGEPIRVLLGIDGEVLGARAQARPVTPPLSDPLPGFPTNAIDP